MAHLTLFFLGTFQVTLGGKPVTAFVSDKARALLAYLAVEADRPHRRETLAGLLWPDCPQTAALNSLRQALFNLRQVISGQNASSPVLFITRQTIQFNPHGDHWLDVAAFTQRLAANRHHAHPLRELCELCLRHLQQAAELYRGNFLEGLTLKDSLAFDEWALLKREWLHNQALDVFQRLADYHEGCGHHEQARQYALRQIELDPFIPFVASASIFYSAYFTLRK